MSLSGVYQIQSIKKPKRIYIGSSVRIDKRWKEHLNNLRKNIHPNLKLQYHFNKYGESDFQFSVLIGCAREDLLKWEQYFLDSNKAWFNNSPTAGNNLGMKASDETRNKLRISHLGYKWSEESRKRLSDSIRGKKKPEGFSQKLREANLGKKHSEETKKKIGNIKKGNKNMLGHKHSEEAKIKIRERRAIQTFSEESMKKKSESLKRAWAKRKLKKIA